MATYQVVPGLPRGAKSLGTHSLSALRVVARALPVVVLISGCEFYRPIVGPEFSGTAGLELRGSSTHVTLTSKTAWLLEKSGSISGSTVTWNITATEGETTSEHLALQAHLSVTNDGNGPAPIGNVVVNLQKRVGNQWVTVSSNIADATYGDDATSARIHAQASSERKAEFSENSASGELRFMDASTNTVLSLTPQVAIEPGKTYEILLQASFDNNVLELSAGTPIRAEVIVTFGNASKGNSTADLDINGNGVIDSYERRIRSVPERFGLTVPAETAGNGPVELIDTLDEITTTGTVTFSNVQFNLGTMSGTVTATVDGGTEGGTITNCAHLRSVGSSNGGEFPGVNGVDLTDCSTIEVDAASCTQGTPGCGWQIGDVHSLGQFNWASSAGGAGLLLANYSVVYASTAGVLTVGVVSATAFSLTFTTVQALLNYLPATGPAAPLTSDHVNPSTTPSGEFGGNVVALKLNIDFSDQGVLEHRGPAFGDVLLCNVTPGALNGTTVRNLLDQANTVLAGLPSGFTAAQLSQLITEVNFAFAGGVPSIFAQQHLFTDSCP